MRELEERENRAGYQEELDERLALAGAFGAAGDTFRAYELDQIPDPEDEDLDEDELEDEELFHQILEPGHARFVAGELARSRSGDVDVRKE